MKFKYDLLLNEIDKHYKASKLEYKIMMFCKDIKIKIYRFKRIMEGKAFFQNDEIYRIIDLFKIESNQIIKTFLNLV